MKPIIVDLYLTYHCNLSCQHCCHSAGPHRTESMTYEQIKFVDSWLTAIKAMGRSVLAIGFTGGEPTLHPHFNEIVMMLSHHKKTSQFALLTNGTQPVGIKHKGVFDSITISADIFHKEQTDITANLRSLVDVTPRVVYSSGTIFRDKGRCENIVNTLNFVGKLCTHHKVTNQGKTIRICFDPLTIRFCLENSLYKEEAPENFVEYKKDFLTNPDKLVELADNFTLSCSGDRCPHPCKYYKK